MRFFLQNCKFCCTFVPLKLLKRSSTSYLMKKHFSLFLVLATVTCLYAQTKKPDFQVGDLSYRITTTSIDYPTVEVWNPTLVFNEGNYSISTNAYYWLEDVLIPNKVEYDGETYEVTSIGMLAFYDCSSLTSITIPNSVTNIEDDAFIKSPFISIIVEEENCVYDSRENCNAIIETATNTLITGCQNTIIPNSVTSIGKNAFYGCPSLKSITIPNSVTSIGENAFYGCPSLKSITIPNSVTSIETTAFHGCQSLTSIKVNEGNAIYDSREKCNAIIKTATNTLIIGCQNTIIPNSVTSIGESAFRECSSLTSITIPNSVTSIGNAAFCSCSSLNSITILDGVTSIGQHAFEFCNALTSITIPNSVTNIENGAFYQCRSLTSITSHATTPPIIKSSTFDGVDKTIPVYVPCECIPKYESTNYWSDFTNIQEPTVTYSINVYSKDSKMGSAKVISHDVCSSQIFATANYGYSFTQWSDGDTDNPRTLTLTQDTILTAEFETNQYTITTRASHSERGTTQVDTTVNYLEYISISATANYGYHFAKWSDGITDNPRQIQVTKDTIYTAIFDKNTYTISLSCNKERGSVDGATSAEYLDKVTLTATANYGYHFAKWSDGNTDNPRTLTLTQDTILTAEFETNQYTITTRASHSERGTTQGDTTVNYLEYISISATANYGYHFTQWYDGNDNNPRQIQVTDNATYTAAFEKNTYTISFSCNKEQGSIHGKTSAKYLDKVTLTATPKHGYHFTKWSDGNTDNPRSFTITQDTTFTAEFAQSFSGQCGDKLYWVYDQATQTISITGSGNMYNYTSNTQPWALFKEQIEKLTTSNTTTNIGTSAFEGCIRLGKVSIGSAIEHINAYAFAECNRLYHIYCYPTYPPFIEESSFANYNVYLHIPCDYKEGYELDIVWGNFKYIECIGAESGTTKPNTVIVTPGITDVTITWPTESTADTYSIVIKKSNEVVCTLTFNADGQLLNIAFSPGRESNHPAQYAEQTGNGYCFTVTGLEESTLYTYSIDVKNAANKTIKSHRGEFITESLTALPNLSIRQGETGEGINCKKIIHNGQLLIFHNGKTYNVMGQGL